MTFEEFQKALPNIRHPEEHQRKAQRLRRGVDLARDVGLVVGLIPLESCEPWERGVLTCDALGDILWAVANIADSTGLNLDDIARHVVEKHRARGSKGVIHAITK